jgi:hypothetical protein
MPQDIRIDRNMGLFVFTSGGQRTAQLSWVFGKGDILLIQYGVAVFDGCAPEDSIPVRVSGQSGRLRMAGNHSDLIWPATLERPWGTYGLSGPFSRQKILPMARSMTPAVASNAHDVGC